MSTVIQEREFIELFDDGIQCLREFCNRFALPRSIRPDHIRGSTTYAFDAIRKQIIFWKLAPEISGATLGILTELASKG